MVKDYFWYVIRNYNTVMNEAVVGPNCIDSNICRGDCCSIKIDVPKILAKEYIEKGYAVNEDFVRSNVFSFQLRFDEKTGKCFLFDKILNGCKVHNSGIKPPQCWIYPTKFSNHKNKEISCKRAKGWKIVDFEKTRKAKELLQKYIFLCKLEAKKELKKINKRIGKTNFKNSEKIVENLRKDLMNLPPSRVAGFRDSWNSFKILSAEGLSLQVKKFCLNANKNCHYLSNNFLECKNICEKVANNLIFFLHEHLYNYLKKEGLESLDINGEYPFIRFKSTINFMHL